MAQPPVPIHLVSHSLKLPPSGGFPNVPRRRAIRLTNKAAEPGRLRPVTTHPAGALVITSRTMPVRLVIGTGTVINALPGSSHEASVNVNGFPENFGGI